MSGEQELRASIQLGRGIRLPVLVEVTAKGNGTLRAGGIELRVYDGHDDGTLFQPTMLNVAFVDLEGDGINEMIVEGTEIVSDDDGKEVERRAILRAFRYSTERMRFEEIGGSG